MVITQFVLEWFAGINCIILRSRRSKTKFATIKWYNLCRQIIQSPTCYPLIYCIILCCLHFIAEPLIGIASLQHPYLTVTVLVSSPFHWYHVMTLALNFNLVQDQILKTLIHIISAEVSMIEHSYLVYMILATRAFWSCHDLTLTFFKVKFENFNFILIFRNTVFTIQHSYLVCMNLVTRSIAACPMLWPWPRSRSDLLDFEYGYIF